MAVITMFLFKRGSRNHADNTANKMHYRKNIEQLFEFNLPDMDTANELLKRLDIEELEIIKKNMISILIARKVFKKYRIFGEYYNIAIDGTGVHSYNYEPYPECPYKVSKLGKKTWTSFVLEAKIVCSNGFSISIATEWIKNPTDEKFDKQDCEQKAFARLSEKLKKFYPRLPICITADGLYPNQTVFNICSNNNWKYIITFKDGNLSSVWEEIEFLRVIDGKLTSEIKRIKPNLLITEQYQAYQNIDYKQFKLNVVETLIFEKEIKVAKANQAISETLRFVHVTNFELKTSILSKISSAGRMRWKIENEGFNEQKTTKYNLHHKYSRTSFRATQNYYQCLQIAHIINQLAQKSKAISCLIKGQDSIKSFEELIVSLLLMRDLSRDIVLLKYLQTNCQFRY